MTLPIHCFKILVDNSLKLCYNTQKGKVIELLLGLDVGNSNISVGVFRNESAEPLFCAKLSSSPLRSADEYRVLLWNLLNLHGISPDSIDRAAMASVVPALTGLLTEAVAKLNGAPMLTVGPGVKTGFSIRIDDPSELGADQVANTAGALALYSAPLILVDAGTVTVISAVDGDKNYLGCAILPGMRTCADYFKQSTALLPSFELMPLGRLPQERRSDEALLGKNSADSMRTGLVMGSAMMVDGFVEAYRRHLSGSATVVVTGGSAAMLKAACKSEMVEEEHLTLKGLARLVELNRKKKK